MIPFVVREVLSRWRTRDGIAIARLRIMDWHDLTSTNGLTEVIIMDGLHVRCITDGCRAGRTNDDGVSFSFTDE